MAFLYVLQSETSGRYYVGSTNDLARRLQEHGRGQTASTRGRGPWNVVHQESYPSLLEAHRRELEIKGWKSAKMMAALVRGTVG